jgi:hypothetical protein
MYGKINVPKPIWPQEPVTPPEGLPEEQKPLAAEIYHKAMYDDIIALL